MKVYVAGPMTGLPEFNHPAFHAAAEQLTEMGYEVLNPARHDVDPAKTWADYMRLGVADVLTVDAVVLLPGYEQSRGAALELTVARALQLKVVSLAAALAGGL